MSKHEWDVLIVATSATNLANTWARELGVEEAPDERGLHRLIGRLWDKIASVRIERDELADFIRRRGYRRCDIAACNCNSFHGGQAEDRLREIYEALGARTQGRTALEVVRELVARDEGGEG